MKSPRAFTLIELLVVIAIIGLLSSIVLAALGNAKTKGNDAAVEEQMHNVINAAEIYRSQNTTDSYGPTTASGACTGLSMWTSANGNMSNIMTAITNAAGSANLDCGTTGTSGAPQQWSLAVQLPSGAFFCVDSTGYAGSARKSNGLPYLTLSGGNRSAHATAGDTVCN